MFVLTEWNVAGRNVHGNDGCLIKPMEIVVSWLGIVFRSVAFALGVYMP